MKRHLPPLLVGALLLSAGCDRALHHARGTVYVPWEEGLTLVYEDPTLPPKERFDARLQRRVSSSKVGPEGRRVTITYSSLKSNQTFDFLTRNGSWVILEGNTPLMQMLPEGFPESTSRWEDRTTRATFTVLGRGALQDPELQLPDDFDRTGVWVEMDFPSGAKNRIFFLPGIGEAEGFVLKDGQWIQVNRLVSRGFTDPPVGSPGAKTP